MTQFVVCGLTWHRRGLHSAAQYLPRKNAKTTQNAGLASYGTYMFHVVLRRSSTAQIWRLKLLNWRQMCRRSALISGSGTKSKTANSMPDPAGPCTSRAPRGAGRDRVISQGDTKTRSSFGILVAGCCTENWKLKTGNCKLLPR